MRVCVHVWVVGAVFCTFHYVAVGNGHLTTYANNTPVRMSILLEKPRKHFFCLYSSTLLRDAASNLAKSRDIKAITSALGVRSRRPLRTVSVSMHHVSHSQY